jgi:hypothetical protein
MNPASSSSLASAKQLSTLCKRKTPESKFRGIAYAKEAPLQARRKTREKNA